jgi:hypothetical protein
MTLRIVDWRLPIDVHLVPATRNRGCEYGPLRFEHTAL